jgi:hypothetical protein
MKGLVERERYSRKKGLQKKAKERGSQLQTSVRGARNEYLCYFFYKRSKMGVGSGEAGRISKVRIKEYQGYVHEQKKVGR